MLRPPVINLSHSLSEKPCQQDPMLHFPFDSDFDNVGCLIAKGVNYGSGSSIVKKHGKAFVCFVGHSHIEVMAGHVRN